ncbi:YajG family lipoprotein [Dasania marina]|uniref:YajG family lipoprotein n=1 Tax=Dasania marina TaxID=471499 RepID=UPI000373D54D|nr:YajG family lipoprotein [Dasania marina]
MLSVKKLLLVIAAAAMAACAYSPQQVMIQPELEVADDIYGQGRIVAVLAEDQRSNKAIGSRGGAYPGTSLITPANDVGEAMVKAAKAGLRQQGFSVDSDQPPAATVKVIVDTLTYENDKDTVTAKVNLLAVLRVEINVAEKNHSGVYKSAISQQLVIKPTAATNEKLINKVLSQTLQRALNDPKVKAFLSNS